MQAAQAQSDDSFAMYLAGNFPSPVEAHYPGPMDAQSGADYTFDLSMFPSDTVSSSGDLATWANLPAQPSPPAQMPDLIPPEAQIPYPVEYWPPVQQMNPQYATYDQQQQYYLPDTSSYDPNFASDTESFSPATPYDGSAPVTPIQPVMEPEEKAFYKFIKDGLDLASPTPTSAYGMPTFLSY